MCTEHFFQPTKLLFKSASKYDDVVQIDEAGNIWQAWQDKIHKSLKDAWCTCQSKWHDVKAVTSFASNEKRLVAILVGNGYIIISRAQIQGAKPGWSGQSIQTVIYQWRRIAILVSNGIYSSVVNAETEISVFLTNEDDIGLPWTGSRLNNAVTFHFFYMSVSDF